MLKWFYYIRLLQQLFCQFCYIDSDLSHWIIACYLLVYCGIRSADRRYNVAVVQLHKHIFQLKKRPDMEHEYVRLSGNHFHNTIIFRSSLINIGILPKHAATTIQYFVYDSIDDAMSACWGLQLARYVSFRRPHMKMVCSGTASGETKIIKKILY